MQTAAFIDGERRALLVRGSRSSQSPGLDTATYSSPVTSSWAIDQSMASSRLGRWCSRDTVTAHVSRGIRSLRAGVGLRFVDGVDLRHDFIRQLHVDARDIRLQLRHRGLRR